MYGSKPGYASSSFWRSVRCTEDLTFERVPVGILGVLVVDDGVGGGMGCCCEGGG